MGILLKISSFWVCCINILSKKPEWTETKVVVCLNLLNRDDLRNLSALRSHDCLSFLPPAKSYLTVGTWRKYKEKKKKTEHGRNNEQTMQHSQPGMKNYVLKLRGQVSHQLDFNSAWQKCLYLYSNCFNI